MQEAAETQFYNCVLSGSTCLSPPQQQLAPVMGEILDLLRDLTYSPSPPDIGYGSHGSSPLDPLESHGTPSSSIEPPTPTRISEETSAAGGVASLDHLFAPDQPDSGYSHPDPDPVHPERYYDDDDVVLNAEEVASFDDGDLILDAFLPTSDGPAADSLTAKKLPTASTPHQQHTEKQQLQAVAGTPPSSKKASKHRSHRHERKFKSAERSFKSQPSQR